MPVFDAQSDAQFDAKFSAGNQESVHTPKSGEQPIHYPLIFGGSAAAMATLITHPLDIGKTH
jgi:hypothetical protein